MIELSFCDVVSVGCQMTRASGNRRASSLNVMGDIVFDLGVFVDGAGDVGKFVQY